MKEFGERIKELRIESGLTQTELANELGYSQGAIAHWESNSKTPNIDVAASFAKYFRVTADFLLGLSDE